MHYFLSKITCVFVIIMQHLPKKTCQYAGLLLGIVLCGAVFVSLRSESDEEIPRLQSLEVRERNQEGRPQRDRHVAVCKLSKP